MLASTQLDSLLLSPTTGVRLEMGTGDAGLYISNDADWPAPGAKVARAKKRQSPRAGISCCFLRCARNSLCVGQSQSLAPILHLDRLAGWLACGDVVVVVVVVVVRPRTVVNKSWLKTFIGVAVCSVGR